MWIQTSKVHGIESNPIKPVFDMGVSRNYLVRKENYWMAPAISLFERLSRKYHAFVFLRSLALHFSPIQKTLLETGKADAPFFSGVANSFDELSRLGALGPTIMRRVREAQLVYAKLFMCVDSYRHGFLPC